MVSHGNGGYIYLNCYVNEYKNWGQAELEKGKMVKRNAWELGFYIV